MTFSFSYRSCSSTSRGDGDEGVVVGLALVLEEDELALARSSEPFCVDVGPLPIDEPATSGAVEVRIVAVGLVGADMVPLGDLGADDDDDGTWLGV